MNKTSFGGSTEKKVLVDLSGLQAMTSLGRSACEKLAADAGAVVRVGRRKMYSVQKIEDHIRTVSEQK